MSSLRGELNGKPFKELRDADPDIGARLEVFAAGAYVWIPFEHIASIEMRPPQRLRDTLWAPLGAGGSVVSRHGPRRSADPGDLSILLEAPGRSRVARKNDGLGG